MTSINLPLGNIVLHMRDPEHFDITCAEQYVGTVARINARWRVLLKSRPPAYFEDFAAAAHHLQSTPI
jgi:hypothetical protein